jgi:hypothetical protein
VIALSGANRPQNGPEDGLLTGLEVASLHLSGTKLVVLSSCQSANGTLVNGQGIPGLRAAFSIAGAHALVMNVWPVDDQASRQFMQFFYSHLDQGPAEAMRQAQRHFMNHAQFQNPLYWAGYTYSDNSPADRGTNSVFQSLQEAGAAELRKQNEQLIPPRCFQLSGVTSASRGLTNRFTARIKLGGVVHKLQSSDEFAVYDTHLPGNEFEFVNDINGTPIDDPRRASEENAFKVVIHRTKDSSSIAFQMGEPPFYTIMLKGSDKMFPDLEIPKKLPQISAIYMLRQGHPDDPVQSEMQSVDRAGFCDSTPLARYSDGIIRSTVPLPTARTDAAPPKHEPSKTPPAPAPGPVPAPQAATEELLRKTRMETLALYIVTFMANNQFEVVRAMYSEQMPSNLTAETLRNNWRQKVELFGPFDKVLKIEKDPNQNVVAAYCQFKTGQIRVELALDKTLTKIIGIYIRPATDPRAMPPK